MPVDSTLNEYLVNVKVLDNWELQNSIVEGNPKVDNCIHLCAIRSGLFSI